MALKDQILTTIKPKIALKDLSIYDIDFMAPREVKADFTDEYKESVGALVPLIMINGVRLHDEMIMSMDLRQDSFLPTLNITFIDNLGLFSSYHNPIFEPIVSIYVKSQTPYLKPLRGDYLILRKTSVPIRGEAEHIITLFCELYVPKLYNNASLAYADMTSVECLKKVATELELGFATNEEVMNDKMTWLNPNLSYYMFIKEEVTKRAYKSDKSFFTCFIDRYYVLNFVNVERQMEQDNDFDMNYITSDTVSNSSVMKGGGERGESLELINQTVLSNHPSMTNNANHIQEFWPSSNNGDVLKNQSFRSRAIWYESETQKVNSFFLEPLSNVKTLNGSEHQTPSLESLKTMEVKKWLGFDYGNAHKHNKYAKMLNHHNNLEIGKNQITLRLKGFNSTILRGVRVPVVFYDETYVNSIKMTLQGKGDKIKSTKSNDFFVDEILSDIYYVKDIVYRYDSSVQSTSLMNTEITIAKRNWKKTVYNNAE